MATKYGYLIMQEAHPKNESINLSAGKSKETWSEILALENLGF